MIDSKTPDEALKTLLEADYGYGTDIKSVYNMKYF